MPKQDRVQRINQKRARPTDTLGVAGSVIGSGSSPGTLSATTTNDDAAPHTHEIEASWDPGAAESVLKTNDAGWLNLVRLYLDELYAETGADLALVLGDDGGANKVSIQDSTGAEVAYIDSYGQALFDWLESTWGAWFGDDVDVIGDVYVDGDLYVNDGPLRLNGGYIGAYTEDYSWTWLAVTAGPYDETQEVWDFGASCGWGDVLDGFGGHFTFRARTVYGGSSGTFPALARWHWWADAVTQETYKGAAGIALLKGDGGNGDGTEELVLSLIAGGDHTLKLQDNAGATSLVIEDSDSTEVASIDSDGLLTAIGMVSGGHLLPAASEAYDLGSPSRLWRSGYLSELRALLFAEETIQLVGGWLIVPKDAGAFEADVADTDLTIDFGKAMTPGHWVLVRSYDASTGMPAAEYLTVGSLVSGTTYNVTRNVDGSGANDWAAGTPFLVLGEEGDGRIELNAYDTPRIQILQQGAAYNLADEVVRIGDLNGSFGITSELYGFGVGDYAEKNYLRYDPTNGFLLCAGGGEITIDDTGITVGYDADVAFRLEADSGGTIFDVIYHDADANALHIVSATRYWELMESGGAKWAMDGNFVKAQARAGGSRIDLALGDADNNWSMLTAHDGPGVILSVGTGNTPTPAVDWREHSIGSLDNNARRMPQMIWVGAETNAGQSCQILVTVVKYAWVHLAAFNVDTGAAIARCICEIARPGSGSVDRYFTSDRTYVYTTSGALVLKLWSGGTLTLYNNSAAKVRWVGWVMYYSA